MTDILQIFEREGFELRRIGHEYSCLCPFHDDRKPSLHINPDKGVWLCRACNEGGDAIGFVMKYRNLTFPEAKKYLGMADDRPAPARVDNRRKFRGWCTDELERLFILVNDTHEVLRHSESIAWLECYGGIEDVRDLSKNEYHLDILMGNDDELKFYLYKSRL